MSLSSKIKVAAVAFALALAGAGAMTSYTYAYPVDENGEREEVSPNPTPSTNGSWQEGVDDAKGDGVPSEIDGNNGVVKSIINGVLYVVGVLAVVMVIIGGVQYTTSGGDQAAVTKAKNTILYGIVGLVIAILAYAIVNFVMTKVTS